MFIEAVRRIEGLQRPCTVIKVQENVVVAMKVPEEAVRVLMEFIRVLILAVGVLYKP